MNNSQTEQWLKHLNVSFSPLREIPLDEIDEKASRTNQARAEAIDLEVVERYIAGMKNGDEFPAVLVFKRGAKYILIDGNHRHAAAKNKLSGRTTLPIYEIDAETPGEVIDLLTVGANTKHGAPTTNAWRARQAMYLIERGLPEERVSEELSVSLSAIRNAQREEKGNERAHQLGINGWDELTSIHKRRLASREFSDALMIALSNLVIETQLPSGAAFDQILREVKTAVTNEDQLRVVEQIKTQRIKDRDRAKKIGKDSKRINNPKQRILSAIGAILSIDKSDIERYFVTEDERKEISRRFGDASIKLMECEEALNIES